MDKTFRYTENTDQTRGTSQAKEQTSVEVDSVGYVTDVLK